MSDAAVGPYAELEPGSAEAQDAASIATFCVESGARALLAGPGALPPAFFDLSSGFAGELVRKLGLYGIRLAVVVPDVAAHSLPFQDFAREANRGRQFRFFPTREEAVRWLESD